MLEGRASGRGKGLGGFGPRPVRRLGGAGRGALDFQNAVLLLYSNIAGDEREPPRSCARFHGAPGNGLFLAKPGKRLCHVIERGEDIGCGDFLTADFYE